MAKKGFDINLYMKAVGNFFNDFFGKKLQMFLKDPNKYLNQAGPWFTSLPTDEKSAYGILGAGCLFVTIGIIILIFI